MNVTLIPSEEFSRQFKQLAKKYKSLGEDYKVLKEELLKNPLQGDDLGGGEKLADNGSSRAIFETTEDRLTFLIHIPSHAGCGDKPVETGGSEKNGFGSEKSSEKKVGGSEKSAAINRTILAAIQQNAKVSVAEIAIRIGLSTRAVEKRKRTLREDGIIRHIGPDKGGHWEIV